MLGHRAPEERSFARASGRSGKQCSSHPKNLAIDRDRGSSELTALPWRHSLRRGSRHHARRIGYSGEPGMRKCGHVDSHELGARRARRCSRSLHGRSVVCSPDRARSLRSWFRNARMNWHRDARGTSASGLDVEGTTKSFSGIDARSRALRCCSPPARSRSPSRRKRATRGDPDHAQPLRDRGRDGTARGTIFVTSELAEGSTSSWSGRG